MSAPLSKSNSTIEICPHSEAQKRAVYPSYEVKSDKIGKMIIKWQLHYVFWYTLNKQRENKLDILNQEILKI